MISISIIGTGNVGYHLAKAIFLSGGNILQVYGRNIETAKKIADDVYAQPIDQFSDLKPTDIVIIAVSDDAIKDVVKVLPQEIKDHAIVAHTSGTKPLKLLKGCSSKAIFYPLQTFTKGIDIKYDNIPFCLNGKTTVIDILQQVASSISSKVITISDTERREAHLSAVIINNLTNHLIYLAKDRLKSLEIDETILDPLLDETVRKQEILSPFLAQTGPARRDDRKTIEKHLALLEGNKDLYHIYEAITNSIIKNYK